MVSYLILKNLKETLIDSSSLDSSTKGVIDDIRRSLYDFIQKNKERRIPFDKRRPIGFKRAKKPDILNREKLTKDDSIRNDINSDFNKLSPKNFNKLSERILTVLEKHTDLVSFVVENCFSKATTQSIFCEMYVKFIQMLGDKHSDINKIIYEKCDMFNKQLSEFKDSEGGYRTEVTKENYDLFCEETKKKQFKKGYSQFIAKLFCANLIQIKELRNTLEQIQRNIEESKDDTNSSYVEDNITCYIETLDKSCNKNNIELFALDIFFCEKMKVIKNLPKRLKFKIMDFQDKIKKLQKN
jgi:hypothetical protein